MLPLEGIRIVEMGTVLMAPYAAQWLADLGADVIKVEPPQGDQTRETGASREPGMATMFLALNRNKRSIVIDLKTAEGREELHALLRTADALIHNIRPQKLKDLELDPETVRSRHPQIVYASVTGYASGGYCSGKPAYDDIIQGLSGVADLVYRQTGELRYAPMALADKTCGIVAAMAICAALTRRGLTGIGTVIEVPMFETMVAFNMVENFGGQHFTGEQGAMGYGRTLAETRGPYRTQDGHISFMPYTDQQWRSFFTIAQRPDLVADDRFAGMAKRTENIDALYKLVGEILLTRTSAEWLALAEDAQIPAGPVLSLEEIVAERQLAETGFFARAVDPAMGPLNFPGVPLTFDGERPPVRLPPRLDQDREAILAELKVTGGA